MKPSSTKPFYRQDLDYKVRCLFCKRATPANLWTCPCGKKWHICQIHGKGHGEHRPTAGVPRTKPKKPGAKPCLKRSFKMTYNEMLEQEAKSKKARTESTYQPTMQCGASRVAGLLELPTKLGPKIRARFGHLVSWVNQNTNL